MACYTICISSPSGGGKTTVVRRLTELLPTSVALYFDDYDDIGEGANVHPESLRRRILDGADYNAWQMPGLIRDLAQLKRGQAIRTVTDGRLLASQPVIFLDVAFGRAHDALRPYLGLAIYIDTPLDVAMARRIQRDYFAGDQIDATAALAQIGAMTAAYLTWARDAYLLMGRQVKPRCDLVLDGCLPVDLLAAQILAELKERFPNDNSVCGFNPEFPNCL